MTDREISLIKLLRPEVRAAYHCYRSDLRTAGLNTRVVFTLRTLAQQKALVEAGKSSRGNFLSWHMLGRAIDELLIDPDTGKVDEAGKRRDLYLERAKIAERQGFRQLGFDTITGKPTYINTVKGKVWDGGHIEFRAPHASIIDACKAEAPELLKAAGK